MHRVVAVVTAVALVGCAHGLGSGRGARSWRSPSGTQLLEQVEAPKGSAPPHWLVLKGTSSEDWLWRYEFFATVEVLWSPDGSAFAINDHLTPEATALTVVDARDPERVYLINDLVEALPSETDHFAKNDHAYVEAVGWTGDRELEVRGSGKGANDPDGFERHYVYTVGGSLRVK